MSSFAAASTIPVTNKVAHANSRTSFRILAMTAPLHYCPTHCRRSRDGCRMMGIHFFWMLCSRKFLTTHPHDVVVGQAEAYPGVVYRPA